MKPIEAKIIILLSQLHPMKRNIISLSVKLDKSYDYVSKLLNIMIEKRFIIGEIHAGKKFFIIKDQDLIKKAKEVLSEVK